VVSEPPGGLQISNATGPPVIQVAVKFR